jgi:hypothetical protein
MAHFYAETIGITMGSAGERTAAVAAGDQAYGCGLPDY